MDPSRATQLALGFWPARAFSAALELGIYDLLSGGAMDADQIAERLGLRSPSLPALLDALVGLGALARADGRYSLVGPVDAGLAELAGTAAYRAWADLPAALRGDVRPTMFSDLAADPAALRRFVEAMGSVSAPLHAALIERLDGAGTVCDVGGADGRLAVALARRHPGLRVITFDLPALLPLAEATIEAAGVGGRVTAVAGDFLSDPLPSVDTVVLSLVLLDWPVDDKRRLLAAVAQALPEGGKVVVLDRMEQRPGPERGTFELLRSLHLLVTHGDAFPFSVEELAGWLAEAGFSSPVAVPLGDGFSLAVADRTG